jgi:hypothetical protein
MTTPNKKRQTAGRRRVRVFRLLALLTGATFAYPCAEKAPAVDAALRPDLSWIALPNPMSNQGASRKSVTSSWSLVRAADVAGTVSHCPQTPHTHVGELRRQRRRVQAGGPAQPRQQRWAACTGR